MESDEIIRPAVLEDAPSLARLLRRLGWMRVFQAESETESEQRVTRHLALCLDSREHSVWVAAAPGGQAVGYVSVHWLPYLILASSEGYISELFLDPDASGRGLGTRLLAEVKAEARQRGCARLSLLNMRERESYQRQFYAKDGWEERPDAANFIFRL